MSDCLTYSVPEAAGLLGVSSRFVYQLVQRDELRAVHLGRRILIPRVALDELLAAS